MHSPVVISTPGLIQAHNIVLLAVAIAVAVGCWLLLFNIYLPAVIFQLIYFSETFSNFLIFVS